MLSESARATSAAESRFRVQAPNSAPRVVAAVALDAEGEALAASLAAQPWTGAAFWHWRDFAPAEGGGLAAFLADLAGRTRRVVDVVADADLVVLLAGMDGAAGAALPIVAEAASARRVSCVGILLAAPEAGDAELAAPLARLRPHVGMLVVARDRDYARAMMEALRA